MARIGLNNLWYSKLTEAQDGTPSYDGAKSFGKAVSANVSITNNSASLYADDVLAESDTSFQSGTVTLGTDDDREATFADILGHEISEEGEVTRNANDTAPWVGLARIVVKMVQNVRLYKVEVLYKVKFSEPSQDDQTKGESVEFATPEIEGTIATLANGDWSTAKTFSSKEAAIAFIQAIFAGETSTFRVGYDANGGTGTIASETVNAGSSVTLDSGSGLTAPEGKEFAGWALTSTATEAAYAGGATYTPLADVTFYAVWTAAT
jgi:phi13 family phage major tail protein